MSATSSPLALTIGSRPFFDSASILLADFSVMGSSPLITCVVMISFSGSERSFWKSVSRLVQMPTSLEPILPEAVMGTEE